MMNWLTNILTGMKSLFSKPQVERELDEEIDSYIDASAAHKQSNGMSREAARRQALIEVGSRNAVKHQVWQSRWEALADSLLQDTRLSLRMLAKSPGFTLVALLSLALGIGANTAIFTLIHQVLLNNLPVPHPEQIVHIGESDSGGVAGGIDLGDFGLFPWYISRDLAANHGPFQGIASYGSFSNPASIRLPGAASNTAAMLAPVNLVSGEYFNVLGVQALMGRTIQPADDATPGSGSVAVLSNAFWRHSLASDPAVLGKTITLNGTPFAIVGIMPEGFYGIKQELEPPAVWTPVSMQTAVLIGPSFLTRNGPYFLHLFGRLSPQAASSKRELAQSQNWLDQQLRAGIRAKEGATIKPEREQEINRHTVALVSATHGASSIRAQYGDSLQILMAVVALVLLIACANLANFQLARTAARQREIATRLALGSSRGRIVRQSLIESIILSLVGGSLGLGIAFAATRALIAFFSRGLPYTLLTPTPDLTVLLFTLGICLGTAVLFGLAPALSTARMGAASSLSGNTRASTGSSSARFFPKLLVTAQVMLSLLLLVGAGLFLHTLRNIQTQEFGFDRNNLLLADIDAQLVGYKPSQAPALYQSILERVSALPGVRSAALAGTPPISPGNWSSSIKVPGYTPAPKENTNTILNRVTGQYFETAGIAIVAGRALAPTDTLTGLKVCVVNQTLARQYFPKGDAVGKSLSTDIDAVKGPWQIVGIAHDTKNNSPRETERRKVIYFPLAQMPALVAADPSAKPVGGDVPPGFEENQDRFAHVLVLRTIGDPANTIPDLRAAITQIDPNLPIVKLTTIHEVVDGLMTHEQLISSLTAIFALLAILLAAIGLYGVMSYAVVRRTSEIGIRLALGAQTGTVLWMVLRECFLLLAIGLVLGLPLAFGAAHFVRDQLFGITALDPATFAIAVAVVTAMTAVAGWLPARRAAQVDPMVALRCD